MLRKIAKCLLAFMMILSSFSLSAYAKEEGDTLIINDARLGSGLHQISYGGGWRTSVGYPDRFYNGDEHWFNFARYYNEGDELPYYSVTFKGTGVEIYGEKQPQLGIYNVYIDHEKVETIDAYSQSRVEKTKLFSKEGLTYGVHTLKVELANQKNEASSSCDGEFDYIKVLGFQKDVVENQTTTIIEDSVVTTSNESFKFKYNGDWRAETGYFDLFSNGDDHYSNTAGDSYEMTFVGSRMKVYGSLKSDHGVYDVALDGEVVGTINAQNSTRLHKQLLFDSQELSYGPHSLKVTLQSNSSGAIQLDYVEITHGDLDVDSLQINESEFVGCKGMSFQATTSYTPWLANPDIEWSTSDETKATVDENGLVTIVGSEIGECTLIAKVKGSELKAEAPIEILPEMDVVRAYVGTTAVTANQEFYIDYIKNQEVSTSWHEIGWKGDELLSSIVVLTRDEVTNLCVEASDFVNGDQVFSKENIDIRWLKEVDANIGRSNPSAPVKQFGDVIHKGGSINAPAQKVLTSWINIDIPNDCIPGTYRGSIRVSADELEEPYVFDYSFEVLDIIQPTSNDVDTTIQFWQYPFAVAEYYGLTSDEFFHEEHKMYLRENLKEYASMQAHDLVATVVEEAWNHQCYYSSPSMVKWIENEDGTFSFDYTWYDEWVELAIECGVIDPETKMGQIKCYSIVPWGNKIGYTNKNGEYVATAYTPGSEEWTSMWSQFLEDFTKHSEEKGWFDITYIALDERGVSDLQHSIEIIHSIKNEDGESFKISSALNYSLSGDTTFTDQIDDISMNYGHVPHNSDSFKQFCEHRRSLGLVTTVYTCTGNYPSSFVISDPIDASYAIWYTLYQGADGYLRWAWDSWTNDPLTDVSYKSFEPGDMWFIYPTEKDEESDTYYYSSPRYEMTKQAIRDINKAKYLMSISDQLTQDIEALIDSLKRPNKGSAYGSATYASEADRQITISETKRMRQSLLEISKDYAENGTSTTTKAALRQALDNYEDIYMNSLSYEPSSYHAFVGVYENALAINENRNATQDVVDLVVDELDSAVSELLEIEEPALSNDLINTSAQTDVKVVEFTSQCVPGGNPNEDGQAINLLDYQNNTYWHTDYRNVIGMPQSITFDLGKVYRLSNLTFLPRQGAGSPGKGDPIVIQLYGGTSLDDLTYIGGKTFETLDSVLANRDDFIRVYLASQPMVRFVKFEVIHCGGGDGDNYANAAEMRFYGSEYIDKTALATTLTNAENMLAKADQYEEASVAQLQAAYVDAQAIYYSETATQEEVDAAKANLEATMNAMVEKSIVPAKVENLVATDTNYKTITLTWEASENATSYDVYRKSYKEGATFEYEATVNEPTYEAVGVMTGKEYAFYVVAKNENSVAEASDIVTMATTLKGTVTLAMEQVSTSKFHLSWNKVDGATRYIVYRKRNDDKMKKVLTLGGDVFEYTTAEMPNGDYQFQVKAGRYDSTDRVMTGASNKVKGTVEALKPTVTATAGTKSAKISWKKMEGVTHYQVYRATSSGGKYTKLATTKELSYTAKSLTKGKKYYFKVRGYKTYKSGTDIKYSVYTPYSSIKAVTAK